MKIPFIQIWIDGRDTSEWEKAVLALLISLLFIGLLTIWQIREVAPPFLYQGAIAVYILLLILTIITRYRILWVYPVDGLLGLGLFLAAISQPEHLLMIIRGAQILPTFILIVGNTIALLLGVISLYIFWRRITPQMLARERDYQRVHQNCAADAPCRTNPKYRV